MAELGRQEIKCNVHSCKHNDDAYCVLHDITVGNSSKGEATQKTETECLSFDKQ